MVPPRQPHNPVAIPTTRVVRIIPVGPVGRVTQAMALVTPLVLTAQTILANRGIRAVIPVAQEVGMIRVTQVVALMALVGPVTPEGIRVTPVVPARETNK